MLGSTEACVRQIVRGMLLSFSLLALTKCCPLVSETVAKALGIKGFCAVGGKTAQGKAGPDG